MGLPPIENGTTTRQILSTEEKNVIATDNANASAIN